MTGYISKYEASKGWGFIRIHGPKFSQIFFHISQCHCDPQLNLEVQFEIGEGRSGPAAVNIDEIKAAQS